MVMWDLESQFWEAEFLQPAEIEQDEQRLWVSSRGPGVLPSGGQ